MADTPQHQETPRHPRPEYEDPHFHDDEEVAQPPADDVHSPPAVKPRTGPRKLPPPPRRFYED